MIPGSVALITTSRNEHDIIETFLRHHLAEGVSIVLVADNSDDGTADIIRRVQFETGRIGYTYRPYQYHHQAEMMTKLAYRAWAIGCEWVIASDVDEFWYAVNGGTIKEALSAHGGDVVHARSFQHHDWETRQVEAKRLPKVAFRASQDAVLTTGNHDVSGVSGVGDVVGSGLAIRELQYRGFEHFKLKVATQSATLPPEVRARGDVSHVTRLDGLSDEELMLEWDTMLSTPTVVDPIPSRSTCRPLPFSSPFSVDPIG